MTVIFTLAEARPLSVLDIPSFHHWKFPDGKPWTTFYRIGSNYLLRFPELADFEVSSDGGTVCCWPAPEISNNVIEHLYYNQVLPLAYSRQGRFIFHASAIEINHGAVAFMGESGKGKSTLAASFASNGYRFLTDDGLLLDEVDEGYSVQPSHASIRLWGDSRSMLISESTPLASPLHYTTKARILSGESVAFCDQPRTLNRIYVLGDGSSPKITITPMKASDSLIELVKHSFLLEIEGKQSLSDHFKKIGKLSSHQIYYHLDYPRQFEELASVRLAVSEHLS